MTRILAVCTSLVICSCASIAFAGDGPDKTVPELKVLDHYVGAWDVVITSADSPFRKATVNAKWILGGRFVQQIGTLKSKDGSKTMHFTALMTYDQKKKAYQTWTFLSTGEVAKATGTWNLKLKVMTSVNRESGVTNTTTANFATKGMEKWHIVTTDRTGKMVYELRGISTRRKK